jgi:hypothetical protein
MTTTMIKIKICSLFAAALLFAPVALAHLNAAAGMIA